MITPTTASQQTKIAFVDQIPNQQHYNSKNNNVNPHNDENTNNLAKNDTKDYCYNSIEKKTIKHAENYFDSTDNTHNIEDQDDLSAPENDEADVLDLSGV
uniref:Uncharacterized protein n=1 Tax=Proboscia inermis TaxID=420281 RepID=A0A7S0GHH5_9STRA|mmetsp:Transcript_4095/g.4223  ORF Transcript_4095/g.4223 Transcript_4095/m.4223 type:complete len:100 (+) Transcript_4095:831-1130(+)